MKKLVAVLLVLVMALSLTSVPAFAEAGSHKLTVWCWDPAFNIYAMQEAAKFYKEVDPAFELEVIETPWNDLQTKLTTAGMAGDYSTLPDIFLCQDNAFQKNVMAFPDMFTDLTASGIDFTQFGAAKTAYSVIDGKNYGVPFDNGAVIQAVRTDILEQAGYTVADLTDIDWNRYIEIGEDVLAKTGKPMLSSTAGEPDMVMIMLQSAGASLFDAEGKPAIAGNDVVKKAIELYATLVQKGILVEVTGWDGYIGTLVNGTVAGTINGCWIMASIQTAKDQAGKWAVTNMPKLPDVESATNYSNNGGSSWAVSANCKDTALAFDFLAKTYAGSVAFYEDILPSSGALATYLPAGQSDVYAAPQEFFGGDTVFAKITEFAGKIPSNYTGAYYYEARDAITVAITAIMAGGDADAALSEAQSTVEFAQGV
ncbi:MAG: extracellular solute-binding protein [Clostridiales bacterium]|nr:extracellular solute-binding protein [Clostridiales bacterium]